MIGNAIGRTLDSINRSECHDDNDTLLEPPANITDFEDCKSLKVEMAVTLAFLTGIIMVHAQHSIPGIDTGFFLRGELIVTGPN